MCSSFAGNLIIPVPAFVLTIHGLTLYAPPTVARPDGERSNLMSIYLRCRLALFVFCAAVTAGLTSSQMLADQVGLSGNGSAGASTGGQFNGQQLSVNQVLTPINIPTQAATINFADAQVSTAAAGSAGGTVNFGSITGVVTAAGNEASAVEPPGINLNNTSGSGQFFGIWQDSLLVTSTSLAQGAPVDLLFTMALSGSLTCSGPGASVQVDASFSAGSDVTSFDSTACNSTFPGTETLTVATSVGADLQIQGQILMTATATGVNDVPSTSAVDPPSAEFFIDSVTAGAGYTTGSGNTYFTPRVATPEPSSFLLLGSGLFGLLGVLRGKKK
jgi:hypothetical protein